MKIQYCSDLHLEFPSNRDWIKNNPLIPKAPILIIAGDTYHLDKEFKQLDFIKKVSDEFESVYIIPGNHEYYGGFDISSALKSTNEKIFGNVFLLNNTSIQLGEYKFIFSTMWSKIHNNILEVIHGLADFKLIKYGNERFTINHFNEIHEKAFEFISNEVKTKGKKVIVTHHLPSVECNASEFKNSTLNDAFCIDKTAFILNNDIDCWIYGHSHRNLKDFKIGNTQMLTNQFGYVQLMEHVTFNYEKVIDLV